ncbi:MAG: DUF3710 domain-containing protein [Geodermatophilaceae bacterium]|nr:DUF3710 domain-containing protein [Geodermatophilaceae bacterium]
MALGRRRRLDRSVREKGVAPDAEARVREHDATTGPYDIEDLPGDDALARIDLGALRVPAAPGGDMRLDVNKAGRIISATLRLHGSALQVGAFAAPRNVGIWDDVRAEIVTGLAEQGGSGTETTGSFGVELSATLVTPGGPQPARFVGVDGPRWFLRGLFTGAAATDPAQAAPLEVVFRSIVVVRGTDPMPVREQIPLRLPTDPAKAAAAEAAAESDDGDPDR